MTQPTPAAPAWGVHLKLLGMTALWGASYPWAKAVTQAMPILTAATLRFFLAALALLLWLHHLRRLRALLALNRRQWAAMALAALCGIAVYTASFMYGAPKENPAIAGFFVGFIRNHRSAACARERQK